MNNEIFDKILDSIENKEKANIIDKLFNRIEDDIKFKLSCYGNLISEGKIYFAEEKFCESKRHLLEIIDDRENWENEVNLFLKRIRKEKFRPSDILELQDKLREIFEIGMEKVNQKNKTEIVSSSIGGENIRLNDVLIRLNDVLNRINNFEKNVNENFVYTIDRFLRNIEDAVNKKNRKYDVWREMYESLIEERNSLINMKDDIIAIRNNFLNGNR